MRCGAQAVMELQDALSANAAITSELQDTHAQLQVRPLLPPRVACPHAGRVYVCTQGGRARFQWWIWNDSEEGLLLTTR